MASSIHRRGFLGAAAGTAMAIQVGEVLGAESPGSAAASPREVRLEHLKPKEADEAIEACPVLFQPLGTIEWHGVHNIVGVDALKAHRLCCRAAEQAGGLVAPPLYGGVGGVDQPHTFVIEPENSVFSVLLRSWLERLASEAVRQGFRAVIFLTGHYGAAQQIVVRETAVRMSRALGVPVLGTPEYFLALDEGYHGDHAAWGETVLMMYLYPESVDLNRLGEPPHQGVGGRDPREATQADGERVATAIINRLAALARQMPTWDRATLERFIAAEAALVTRQQALAAGEKTIWAGWRNIGKGHFDDYGRLLADGRFEDIVKLVEKL